VKIDIFQHSNKKKAVNMRIFTFFSETRQQLLKGVLQVISLCTRSSGFTSISYKFVFLAWYAISIIKLHPNLSVSMIPDSCFLWEISTRVTPKTKRPCHEEGHSLKMSYGTLVSYNGYYFLTQSSTSVFVWPG